MSTIPTSPLKISFPRDRLDDRSFFKDITSGDSTSRANITLEYVAIFTQVTTDLTEQIWGVVKTNAQYLMLVYDIEEEVVCRY